MFETIENNEEIIKALVKLIWIATNGKIVNITFDNPILLKKVVLNNDTSKIIILNIPEVPTQESKLIEDTMKNLSNSRLNAFNITSQETNMESNFEISERDSTNDNKREPLQNGSFSSDKYSDMEEENNKLLFDSLALSPEKK
ncbi:hypothetical protein F8M41_006461 [Gigaspora margarita]|uniref:Uncharacterized protein n=1 Tax=Gigaspora margarita TaxID=4874 RepID=A0A8H4A591_GIGMA|nr:hypothetical protein F8M41_006461 [Gigaspora margarita]